MNLPIIEADFVHKAFKQNKILKGVNLKIQENTIVGLLGLNGAGKSTFIKCLLGLLRVDSGAAIIMGDDAWTLSGETKENLGYVPQEIQLYPWIKSNQVIQYTGAFYRDWDQKWVYSLVERWEIPMYQRVSTLSPGELQKLALVLALGHRPKLLILDEPVASLDPHARREFLKSLLELIQDKEQTILFSTHITSDLERVASHVAIMKDGEITIHEELDHLKDRVKRLRISSDSSLPSDLGIPSVLKNEINGNNAVLTVSEINEEAIAKAKSTLNAEVTVEGLNLEEIFLELHSN
jgi:ABC-2 type transport system ATP-binding protein